MLGTAQEAGLLRHRVPRNDIPRRGNERADESHTWAFTA